MDSQEAYSLCQQHIHRYVGVYMKDGSFHDGIVESVDEHHLYLAVPTGDAGGGQTRAVLPFGYGGYGGYPFGYPSYGYGYGFPRRRFGRQILPLAALLALSLLPYY
jgi:hypothetical protein